MIKVEDEIHGRNCTISGCASDIALDIATIFEALSKHEQTELILLTCIDHYLTTRSKELLNKKEKK